MESQGELGVERMCGLAQISRASFYRQWEEHACQELDQELRDLIQRTALQHPYYGYRKVAQSLRRQGRPVKDKKVRRLMHEDNLLAQRRRKFVRTTDSEHDFRVYPNLAKNLVLNDVNQLWVADITYVRLAEEFVYLAVVLDAYSRRVVGWALGQNLDSRLALAALDRAIAARHPRPGLVHHSDRGSQYASNEYVKRLEGIGATLSMSRAGRPWENGKCERFMRTLKEEEIDARSYRNLEELQRNVEEFMETIYNRERLHAALDYLSPVEFEQQHAARPESAPWIPAGLSLRRHEEIYPDASGD
jgi:transposase InsO family protein